jgi:GNAT superfamily N-acetyltransferase
MVPYIPEAKRAGICFAGKTTYYGYFCNDELAGFCGLLFYSNKVVIKSIYVRFEYRGRGIFKMLLSHLVDTSIAREYRIAEATCTEMSIREFLSRGFVAVKRFKKYTKVKHENIQ